jgi:hypothetical protein
VLTALGEAGWSGLVVRSVACASDCTVASLHDGTVVCALDDSLSVVLFLHLELDFVDMLGAVKVSAVAGDMISRSLTRLPVMVIDGDDMQHLLCPNMDVYPAVSNGLLE